MIAAAPLPICALQVAATTMKPAPHGITPHGTHKLLGGSVPRAHASDRLVPALSGKCAVSFASACSAECESAALRAAPKLLAREEPLGSHCLTPRFTGTRSRLQQSCPLSTSSGLPRRRHRRVAASLSTTGLPRRRRRSAPAMPRYYGGDGKRRVPVFCEQSADYKLRKGRAIGWATTTSSKRSAKKSYVGRRSTNYCTKRGASIMLKRARRYLVS